MQRKPSEFSAVDVFSGGGALTVGLKRAGFRVVAAIENDPHANATYRANHPDVRNYERDVRAIDGRQLLKDVPRKTLDLLAGCPPCQGFTSLTSKYKRTDPRNALINEMGRLVEQTRPRVVMMENVPGLTMKGREMFDDFVNRIVRIGYIVRYGVLQVADFGIPQNRRRLVLLAGHRFAIPLPKPTHSQNGNDGLPKWRTVRSAIRGMPKPLTLSQAKRLGGPTAVWWHVVRVLSKENIRRMKHARAGWGWSGIPKRLRPECHQDRLVGFQNVYGRMRWSREAPTITGGCTTFSKGRFGHPSADRTISVWEAALLQTFPEDYIFDVPFIDPVCEIIGNALPCDFAEILARHCAGRLRLRLAS